MDDMQTGAGQGDRRPAVSDHNIGDTERWASLLGGGLVTWAGIKRGGASGLAIGALGGMLLYRGATGHSPLYERLGHSSASATDRGLTGRREVHLSAAMTIGRPKEELYKFWHGFTRLPQIMKFLRDVQPLAGDRTHWVAQAPMGPTLEWDSEVTADEPNERIAWRSVEGSELPNQGEIRFRPAPEGRGTVVQLELHYQPPGGAVGSAVGHFLSGLTEEVFKDDLRRFKRVMETGEIATNKINGRA